MTTYPDLTRYEYWKKVVGLEEPGGDTLNVGWLGPGVPFAAGECASEFVVALVRLCAAPTARTRGFHDCELCDRESPLEIQFGEAAARVGNGEVRVGAATGVRYAAPTLIAHYVVDHGYVPPPEFQLAVIERVPGGCRPGSESTGCSDG